MESIKQTVLQVERLYTKICDLLEPFDRQHGTAAYDMLEDARSVHDLADSIINDTKGVPFDPTHHEDF